MTEQAFINLPAWDGHPRECGTVWELQGRARVARATCGPIRAAARRD